MKWMKCIWPKKVAETDEFIVVKFFGLGSLTRIAYVMDHLPIDKSKVTFITLKSNQGIVEYLGLNAIYVRSNNPFYFIWDCKKTMFKVWKRKGVRILDMERSSNFSGLFRIMLAIRKASSGFYFKDDNTSLGNQNFISLLNKSATNSIAEMFGQTNLQLNEITNKATQSNQVLINVNAGAYLPERMFPLSKFADLVAKLHSENTDWTFLLTGAQSESNRVKQFIDLLDKAGLEQSKIENLAGKQNLNEFLATIKAVDLVITNDSGPIHFAKYLGTRTVGIWGPTAAKTVGYSNSATVLNLISDEKCSPCFVHPKSKVAKACAGQLTCFHNYNIDQMVTKIGEFAGTSAKIGIIDSE